MLGSAIMRIMLLDPASGDRPSRIRLAGGVVCDALGLEPRGRRLDEVLSRQSAADLLGLTKALSDDRPVGTWAGTITRYDSAPMAAKGLIVALSPSGDVGAGCATEAGGQLVFFDELKLWAQGRSVRPRIERTLEPMT